MPRLVHNQSNFTAGELTPRMKGRGDVARYQNGAETIENGYPVVHGGVVRRDGLRYLAETKHGGTRACRLIRYVFNVEQSYVLEFGHQYIRVFNGTTGAVMLNDLLAVLEIASPYAEDQLAAITTKQSGDSMYLLHPDVAPYILRRLTASHWTLTPVFWTVQPFAELGHSPGAALSLSATTVGAGRTFTTTPTSVPDAPTIGTAFPKNGGASVNFTPPANTGGLSIDYYEVTSSPGGIVATGPSSPVQVNGLTNGVIYTFTVKAHNSVGLSAASAASNNVTPTVASGGGTITATANTLNFTTTVNTGLIQNIPGPIASSPDGAAPLSFLWTNLSGDYGIAITRNNTAQVELESEGYGDTNYATLRCTITDALGATGSIDVNVSIRHRFSKYDPNDPLGV